MTPQKLALDPITEGDAWAGIPSLTVLINGVAPASTLDKVTMRFKKAGDVPSDAIELTSEGASPEINIVSAENWEIEIPPQIIPGLTAGRWTWRMRFWDSSADGNPQTYLADELTVLETV